MTANERQARAMLAAILSDQIRELVWYSKGLRMDIRLTRSPARRDELEAELRRVRRQVSRLWKAFRSG